MVLQNSEFDEGIGDSDSLAESWESRKLQSAQHRSFKSLVEVQRFCEARLKRKSINLKERHYQNISKALYLEVSELKAFLGHVLHEFDAKTDVPFESHQRSELAKQYVKEWAQLWIRVMEDLRQKTKEIKEKNDELACGLPETEYYKCTPFDMENIGSTDDLQASFNSLSDKGDTLPENAESQIFDFLRSRVLSQEKINESSLDNPAIVIDSADCEKTLENNRSRPGGGSDKRKVLSVNEGLVRKISNWDEYSSDDTLEQDFLDGSYLSDDDEIEKKRTPQRTSSTPSSKSRHVAQRRTSLSEVFNDSLSSMKLQTLPVTKIPSVGLGRAGANRFSKSELCLHQVNLNDTTKDDEGDQISKVGASLTEIFKVRQELTRAELDFTRDYDVKTGKKCFGCQTNKFTFFQRSTVCSVCKRKYCHKCIREKIPVPPSLADALPMNIDVTYDGKPATSMTRSKSMINVAAFNNRVQLPWKRNPKLSGVRLNMCSECQTFVESIKKEKKNIEWTVQLELDL